MRPVSTGVGWAAGAVVLLLLAALAWSVVATTPQSACRAQVTPAWKKVQEAKPPEVGQADDEDDGDYEDGEPEDLTRKRDPLDNTWNDSWGTILKKSPRKAVTDADIQKALSRARAHLRMAQNYNGSFQDKYGAFAPGETALALLAMRYAGVDVSNSAYQKGLKFVLETDSPKVYANSLVGQILAMAPQEKRPREVRARMVKLAKFFQASQLANGMWSYHLIRNPDEKDMWLYQGDNSNTQFAVLGLWKLADAGIPVNLPMLRKCEKHFMTTVVGAGWSYWPNRQIVSEGKDRDTVLVHNAKRSASMTATGLASLYIMADLLHARDTGRLPIDDRIDAAIGLVAKDLAAWLAAKPDPKSATRNRDHRGRRILNANDLYYLYSVERVGAASGRKFFGSIEWFPKVAHLLLDQQNPNGSWGLMSGRRGSLFGASGNAGAGAKNIVETAFAMLFLARGRAPIFFNKLVYRGGWNVYRQDVAHATRYAGRQLEQHFNWQIVHLDDGPQAWLDAPVLVITGERGPQFSARQQESLKQYAARGGLLFADACNGGRDFTKTIRELGQAAWPDLEWKKLDGKHPLYTQDAHFDLTKQPELWGLTDKQGFTFFVLSPRGISGDWHGNNTRRNRDTFRFAINLFRYALRGKPVRGRVAE